jgi:arabinofuranosyltransferase
VTRLVAEASSAETNVSPHRDARRDLLKYSLILLPIVIFAVAAWKYRWMSDDAFINLRVISEIRAGHGPVFNPGERVEAFTSPLWLGVLLLGSLLTPIRLEYLAVGLGIFCSVAGFTLACLGAVRLHAGAGTGRVWFPAGALVLCVLPPMWKFASSGLETGVTFAWLGACLLVLATWSRRTARMATPGAMVIGVGPLLRPELLIVSIGFLGAVIVGQWAGDSWPRRMGLVAAAFALPFVYEVFRMGYFAGLVANPAFAKEATRSYWSAGWAYFRATFIDTYALWIPVLLLAVTAYLPLARRYRENAQRRALLVMGAFVAGGIVDALYVTRVGGDFMHARLLLPALFLVMAPIAAIPLTTRLLGALLVTPWTLVALVGLRSVDDLPRAFGPSTTNAVTVQDFGMGPGDAGRAWFKGPGVYYYMGRLPGVPSGPKTALATYGVGVASYALGPNTYVLDLFGLGDAFTSHLQLPHRGVVGHEKPLPYPWIVARLLRPGPAAQQLNVSSFSAPFKFFRWKAIDDPRGEPFDQRVADARRALACPRIHAFFSNYEGPLGLSQLIDNFGNAFTNNGFRIPPEPRDALVALCR